MASETPAQDAAKSSTVDFQKVNLLAALRSTVMCKMMHDIATEDNNAEAMKFTRLMLIANLAMLRQYTGADKMYNEAINLPTYAEDKRRYKDVLAKLDEADKNGAQVVLRPTSPQETTQFVVHKPDVVE